MSKWIRGKHCQTIGFSIFSFLLGCMFTINLTPIDKTCKIEDTDREHNIMKNSKLKDPELIILVLSAPDNLDRRDTIRNTWLKLYDKRNEDSDINSFKMKHYFAIGSLGLKADQLLRLSSEQSEHSDILLLPMHDSYMSLTEKVKKSFVWLKDQYDYGLGFKYVLKCDDDSFVNLKALPVEISTMEHTFLKKDHRYTVQSNVQQSSFLSVNVQTNEKVVTGNVLNLYWGYFSGAARVKTRGKWKETSWIASDRYIPYALGGGYILSKDLVSYIAKNAEDLRSFNSEDVSVGFWLAPANNLLRAHDIRFDTEWTSRGCRNTHLVTHNISRQEMTIMYKNFVRFKSLCFKEVDKRSYYVYNWSVPPSQCCKPFTENVIRLQ
ncbi:hypothetical protein NQ318_020088 [Aromia moschata]|uniref:Hexosyltransferase n=1 Tax=Aromia moschata TaxID=1265417 RepID=A0AAV8ZA36_9CUCU|nr:hypothetical protein NQ318_020088 [Aromia moschata]